MVYSSNLSPFWRREEVLFFKEAKTFQPLANFLTEYASSCKTQHSSDLMSQMIWSMCFLLYKKMKFITPPSQDRVL